MTKEAKTLAATLEEASATEAASLWMKLIEDKELAIKVHSEQSEEGKIVQAQKLAQVTPSKNNSDV